MAKMVFSAKIVLAMVLFCLAKFGEPLAHKINTADWGIYKTTYGKEYPTSEDGTAKYNYAYNRNLIARHNAKTGTTFKLAENQFTDIRQKQINALFPKTTPLTGLSLPSDLPLAQPAEESYDPIVDLDVVLAPADQGFVCNSGWAYATARSIEILQVQMGVTSPQLLSAQNLIDCAGSGTGCRNQVPQQAFDYLIFYSQNIKPEADYGNQKTQSGQGMCVPGTGAGIDLAKYSVITNDADLKKFVSNGFGVVIEINPTSFEFMHYKSGIFQPPRVSTTGSHYMTVIGYGHDLGEKLDYWLVQNSFGTTWGEEGRIRIIRNAENTLAKSAIFASELA